MNGYEMIIKLIREQGIVKNAPFMQIGVMESETEVKIDDLKLDKDDLLFPDHLITGYHKAVDAEHPELKNETTYVRPLKKGDIVLIQRITDDTYAVIERLVRA